MSTNRTRASRPPKPVVTDRAIDLFEAHLRLRPQYEVGYSAEYCRVSHDLAVALGAEPFQISGVDADGPEPPAEYRGDKLREDAWRRSWRLRCELEAAAAKRRST